ncbi:MAG TPA: ADOP family duplicated permease [Acidobacteriota bacterium]|nr:ADOP family duplicated permease [Acidobacteriota bacterium]
MNVREIREVVRSKIRRPGLTLAVLLSLSLGIGVNVAVFSIVNAVLLKPMPGVSDPQRLATLTTSPVQYPGMPMPLSPAFSYPYYQALNERLNVFSGLAVFHTGSINFENANNRLALQASFVSQNFFETLEVGPLIGQLDFGGRDAANRNMVVVSEGLWRSLFGQDPEISGRTLTLNGQPFEVVGVPRGGFRGALLGEQSDLWLPLEAAPLLLSMEPERLSDANANWLFWMVGRLRTGADFQQARIGLESAVQELQEVHPRGPTGFQITEGIGFRPGERQKAVDPLAVLLGLAGLVFLTACANVANLYLIRDSDRQTEVAIRLAHGASRPDILRRYLTDALITSALGCGLALWFAAVTTRAVAGVRIGEVLTLPADIAIDARVFGFALGLTLLGAVLIGLFTARNMSQLTPSSILCQARGSGGRGRGLSRFFIGIQIAMSLVLLIGAGLLIQTFQGLRELDLGFQSQGIVNLRLDLSQLEYEPARGKAFWEEVLRRTQRMPGIDSASLALNVPLETQSEGRIAEVAVSHRPDTEWLAFNVVGPDYFKTLGIPLSQGRGFTLADASAGPRVVVINDVMASRLFPGQEAVGASMRIGSADHTVIGVARTVKRHGLDDQPEPYFYLPILQQYEPRAVLHLRGDEALDLVAAVRSEVSRIDPSVLIYTVTPMRSLVNRALSQPRLAAELVGLFSLLALLLAALGLYAVISDSVVQRLPEMGIRMALGGSPWAAVWLALKSSLWPLLAGLAAGYGVAYLLMRVLQPLLYGLESLNFVAFVLFPLVLVVVAVGAALAASWPALRLDPLEVLRFE